MRGRLTHMILILFVLVACEEIYRPSIDGGTNFLVIDAHLTNDTSKNYVRLSFSQSFYDETTAQKVYGAKVELIEIGAETKRATEKSPGYFKFADVPKVGKKYILRVTYQKDLYESAAMTMPPLPAIDALYTRHKPETYYRTGLSGNLTKVETAGRTVNVDIPLASNLEYYRFIWRAILQWEFQPPATPGAFPPVLPPPWYGWTSFYDKGSFNVAGKKDFSGSGMVKNHPIIWLDYNSRSYLDSTNLVPWDWILIIDQYGISRQSFDFYEKMNKQFSADGSLFDPVLTQISGNITCKTNPKKLVAGFFDLKSYRQHRYYISLGPGPDELVIQRKIDNNYSIPDHGVFKNGIHPPFWEYKIK